MPDWDDRHKSVHWVNIPRSATASDSLSDKSLPSPAKKKVKHTDNVSFVYNIVHACVDVLMYMYK